MTPEEIVNKIVTRVKIAEKEDGTPIYIEVSLDEKGKAHIDNVIFEYGMKMYAKGFNDAMAINSKQEFDELNK